VGLGVAKGADVQIAMDKAYRQAKKKLLRIPTVEDTIPHPVWVKFGSARVMIKPAPRGTGLKCGGAVRLVFELAGVPNAVSKVVNSTNKINIAKATLKAIRELRVPKTTEAPKAETAKKEV
jgi:small subunit ribosomal protein S5